MSWKKAYKIALPALRIVPLILILFLFVIPDADSFQDNWGSLLGNEIGTATPIPGTYRASYDFSRTHFRTREIYTRDAITGQARIYLGKDGKATACFGLRTEIIHSISKYVPGYDKGSYEVTKTRQLVGMNGSWAPNDTGMVTLHFTKSWNDDCVENSDNQAREEAILLQCIQVKANDKLPEGALACRLDSPHPLLEKLALNPLDSHRAGPYTLQEIPMGRKQSFDHGEPWLVLGMEPGLAVRSHDEWGRSPQVVFTRELLKFNERNYLPLP